MDENVNNKISEILSSPDLMSNIQNIISSISTKEGEKNEDAHPNKNINNNITEIVEAVTQNGLLSSIGSFFTQNQNERIALLTALRPFLSEEKRETLDFIVQILKAINIFLTVNMFS